MVGAKTASEYKEWNPLRTADVPKIEEVLSTIKTLITDINT